MSVTRNKPKGSTFEYWMVVPDTGAKKRLKKIPNKVDFYCFSKQSEQSGQSEQFEQHKMHNQKKNKYSYINLPIPKGYCNVGDTCYLNSAFQLILPYIDLTFFNFEGNVGSKLHAILQQMYNQIIRVEVKPTRALIEKQVDKLQEILSESLQYSITLRAQQDTGVFLDRLVRRLLSKKAPDSIKVLGIKNRRKVCPTNYDLVFEEMDDQYLLTLKSFHSDNNKVKKFNFNKETVKEMLEKKLKGQFSWVEYEEYKDCDPTVEKKADDHLVHEIFDPPFLLVARFGELREIQGQEPKLKQEDLEFTLDLGKVKPRYKLVGVAVHYGTSSTSGHYVAHVLRKDREGNDIWYFVNDAKVTSHRNIIERTNERTKWGLGAPYVVIYERIA